ncbi:hypothetical protein MARPO_0017s0008 [Marchantia polymorpha]|uniref:Uncharacterized protein n=1 Tax=Marchantia polymorpha TaxID=3197 RepID=A0A2R6XFK0_MARPO|nr:hypothetical protein MARPO_0017s0008 [Marchantia polymorpha]|eukprot:PTQ44883.1 hypothetical protein MARPO_0017s0008 [Marchantia polymorpha]
MTGFESKKSSVTLSCAARRVHRSASITLQGRSHPWDALDVIRKLGHDRWHFRPRNPPSTSIRMSIYPVC